MNVNIQNSITFGHSRKNEYTAHQIKIMKEMKKAALNNGWRDIYTGEYFSRENLPTIEHILPCSLKNSGYVKQLKEGGFQLNGLDNIFPVASLGNSSRKSVPFKKVILETPIIFDRLLTEVDKYRKYKSELINGQDWAKRILKTLVSEIGGISSDIKTRKLFIA